ncbi:MAG: hypothetical protein PHH59_01940 [Methylovulum sp.]|uniref:hypothetical protein n=1 Tax=Methylovulum sp. TaxID=1916980 RepID=UPI0026202813|nr:hypothetical protein [Methylovulum sp.]MDD2722771.1 hypothetical protein [Methylovulum sp.]MDD5124565.1 hypothetical protein [Methylovulum sp.]
MLITLHKPKKRVTAALLHFGASIGFFSLIMWVLINCWYPGVYFDTEGGLQGIKIVAGIDVVLGPLMTLIVFNPQKSTRELTVDIGIIAVVQIMALLWGVYTLHKQRPVAVVFWGKGFMTVPAQALDDQAYKIDGLRAFSDASPAIIYAENPIILADLKKMMDLILKQRIPPHHQTWLYRPLKDHFADIKPRQLNIDGIIAKHPDVKNPLLPILQKHKQSIHDVLYFLLQSKYHDGILIFARNGQYLGAVTPD